jgi:hypothetical protein
MVLWMSVELSEKLRILNHYPPTISTIVGFIRESNTILMYSCKGSHRYLVRKLEESAVSFE